MRKSHRELSNFLDQ